MRLVDYCRRVGVVRAGAAAARLERYLDLLERWNRAYDLTSVREREHLLVHHVFDSLAALPHVAGTRLADVGSGAGLPGIPVAIARPDLAVSLIEARGKRVRFLRHACAALALANVEVVHARAEAHRPAVGFDTLIARALGSLHAFVECSAHLRARGGRWLALKARLDRREIEALPPGLAVDVVRLDVPGIALRHAVVVRALADGDGSRAECSDMGNVARG